MALSPARYELLDWPFGPQVAFEPPTEELGWFLSARNHPLRLERLLGELRADEKAYSAEDETAARRNGTTIRLSGGWGDSELELPFDEFCAAADAFLDWMRSQPAATSKELFVQLTDWLSGAITVEDVRRRDRGYAYDLVTGVELSTEEVDRRLRDELERFVGPYDDPETLERLGQILAGQIRDGQHEPRTAAFAIARPCAATRGSRQRAGSWNQGVRHARGCGK